VTGRPAAADLATLDPVPSEVFKEAMALLAAPVTILTCYDETGTARGMTVSAVTSLSLDPPLLLACLDRRASVHDAFVAARWFCVNLPAPGQEPLVRRFAGPSGWRFSGVEVEPGVVPGISAAPVRFTCERYGVRDGGDHTILLGRVVAVIGAGTEGAGTLVWHHRGFAHACPHDRSAPR
jgi:flavin reductase (DIM6/NTAB) family NADH-FMN oxidoreductase RutF